MFNLRTQVFIALLSISTVLTAGFYTFFSFSFERGFWNYIEQKEIARAAPLIEKLEQHYREYGSWDLFKQNPQVWPEYLGDFIMEGFRERRATQTESFPSPGFNRRMHSLFRSVALLDQDQQFIAGDSRRRRQNYQHKLQVNGEVIGYIGMPLNPALRDLQDAEFAGDQTTNLALIAFAAFLFALVSALPLSHFLTKRILALVEHVKKLSQGEYDKKIPLKGQDELSTLAEHLNDLGHSLQQSEQARRRWVADISHELRTPLAVLQADIEAMEDGVRIFDRNALARLQQHTRRLTNLVSDLYDLSLTDSGALTYRKQVCDVHNIMQEVAAMVRPQFEQRQLDFQCNLTSGKNSSVFGDPQRLHQLFLNLLQNSLHYTHTPGNVSVTIRKEHLKNESIKIEHTQKNRLEKDHQQVIVTIEDSAPGVDEALHEKLFERLYRADSSRNRSNGGAGLGLTICRNIVEAHGGIINIENSRLGGLTLTVILPLSKA